MIGTPPHGPWIDVHAHPGRCFLAGLDAGSPLVQLMGAAQMTQSLESATTAGLSGVSVSTVADLAVIGPRADGGLGAHREFRPGEAKADHERQLTGLRSTLAESTGRTEETGHARSAEDLRRAHESGTTAAFICCEGADFLDGSIAELASAHDSGVRAITLVHYRVNELGDIQTDPPEHGGLTRFGAAVIAEMNRLGIVVDLAHATFETTVGALEASSAPVMISHSHLASPGADHPRLLSEEHAAVVAEAGGLIGAWPAGVTARSLADYVDEICRLVDVVGTDHVAIGTDLDANYRPVLTEYRQFADVAELLGDRGFSALETDLVLGGNALRLFERVWGA